MPSASESEASDDESSGSSSSSSSRNDQAGHKPQAPAVRQSEQVLAPPARPAAASSAPAAPKPRARIQLKVRGNHTTGHKGSRLDEPEDFELKLEALQGRWRHSLAHLGMLTVTGDVAKFAMGKDFRITVLSDGQLDMLGWKALKEMSNANEIVWSKEGQVCSWHFEDELLHPEEIGIDTADIIQGKRHRKLIDRKVIAEEMIRNKQRAKAVYSDMSDQDEAGNDSDEEDDDEEEDAPRGEKRKQSGHSGEAQETLSLQEWQAQHKQKVAQAVQLFERWMLSTRTPQMEDKLQRKGYVSTSLPVMLQGRGRSMLAEALKLYSVQIAHREQGIVLRADADARNRFRAKNQQLWDSTPRPPSVQQAPSQSPAADTSAPPRKRLRKIIQEGDAADDQPPGAEEQSSSPAVSVAPASPPMSIEEAQAQLDAKPAVEQVSVLMAFLAQQQVDIAVLTRTKVGATVNRARKHYAGHHVSEQAAELVERWRCLYHAETRREEAARA